MVERFSPKEDTRVRFLVPPQTTFFIYSELAELSRDRCL